MQVNEVINLDRDSERQVVEDTIKSINRITILNIWRHFISEIKQIKGEISSILNTLTYYFKAIDTVNIESVILQFFSKYIILIFIFYKFLINFFK